MENSDIFHISAKKIDCWFFECHKTFAQEVTVNEKLWKNTVLNLQATYVLDIC